MTNLNRNLKNQRKSNLKITHLKKQYTKQIHRQTQTKNKANTQTQKQILI